MRRISAAVGVARQREDAEVDVLVGVILGDRVAGTADVDAVVAVLVGVVLDQLVSGRRGGGLDSVGRVQPGVVGLEEAGVGVEEEDPHAVLGGGGLGDRQ